MNRPFTTLFMLMSVDGKISTGFGDELDFDRDLPLIDGVKQGLHQYYEIEQTTDLWSFNTGRVMKKTGVNEKKMPEKIPVSFVIADNHHLNEQGVYYMCKRSKDFVLITSNSEHPAFRVKEDNLHILFQNETDLSEAFRILKERYGCERMTIQSGGTMNSLLLKQGLIDQIDIVVVPLLVGGKETPSLIGGTSLTSVDELSGLSALKLLECKALEGSYLRLRYEVVRDA